MGDALYSFPAGGFPINLSERLRRVCWQSYRLRTEFFCDLCKGFETMKIFHWVCVAVLAAMMTGCYGGKRFTMMDEPTPDGVWATGDTLVRMYEGAAMDKAIDGIDAYLKTKKWTVETREIDPREAEIEVKDEKGLDIEFKVWAPEARPYIEVGVEVGGGNIRRSAEIFTELEKHLPGKRMKIQSK